MSKEQETHATPPGIGEGQPWRVRELSWEFFDQPEQSGTMLVPRGMHVNPAMHEHYRTVEAHAEKVFAAHEAAGLAKPSRLVLLDESHTAVGTAPLCPGDGPAEVAWITCAFAELLRVNVAMLLDDAIKPEDAGMPLVRIAADGKAVAS